MTAEKTAYDRALPDNVRLPQDMKEVEKEKEKTTRLLAV